MSRCDIEGKYTDMTVDVLRYHLREAGLKLQGNKAELCERLRAYRESPRYKAEQRRLQEEKAQSEFHREQGKRLEERQERERRWAQTPPYWQPPRPGSPPRWTQAQLSPAPIPLPTYTPGMFGQQQGQPSVFAQPPRPGSPRWTQAQLSPAPIPLPTYTPAVFGQQQGQPSMFAQPSMFGQQQAQPAYPYGMFGQPQVQSSLFRQSAHTPIVSQPHPASSRRVISPPRPRPQSPPRERYQSPYRSVRPISPSRIP